MATAVNAMAEGEDEIVEELEGFDDFTLASSWERFISDIEAVCRLWMVDGRKNLLDKGAEQVSSKDLYKVKSELRYGGKTYCLEYYFIVGNVIVSGESWDWRDDLHRLQLFFGLKEFLVIAPISVSGVILDAPEASKLLSSVAVALSNCGSTWPALVPVHDPSRMAYIGIQNMGVIFTRRFETDRIGSQVPIRLMHLEGLFELFVSKFALSITDISMQLFNVYFTMKLTYKTPPYDDVDDIQGAEISSEGSSTLDSHLKAQWDDDCPWSVWYSAEDPVRGFELITTWSRMMVHSSSDMAEWENSSSVDAKKWALFPILASYLNDDSSEYPLGLASQLHNLVNAFDMCFDAKFMEDLVSADSSGSENIKSADVAPPPTALDRVIKNLFRSGSQNSNRSKREPPNSQAIKGAPPDSLFAQFCLQALWFGNCNIRAIAVLWIEFVREVRWCWDESEALPRMIADEGIDLSTCLVHQKLQMLAICMDQKNIKHGYVEENDLAYSKDNLYDGRDQARSQLYSDKLDHKDNSAEMIEEYQDAVSSLEAETSQQLRRGSSGRVKSMMLLNSYQYMHAPYTQEAPVMTEDMHEERLHAMETFGDSFNFSGQLEKDILSSDMSAFKAANPDGVFEDFIRWHSPGDWENVEGGDNQAEETKANWPPRGKLSQRMSEHGNSWRQLWNNASPLPVSMQKPLIDPVREAEKILHYLETLKPQQLLAQMISTAFRSALDILNRTSYGNLKHMKTRVGQLYLTVASALKFFRGNYLPEKSELIGDLMRLCDVFQHVEMLVLVAASLSRKLSGAPRLGEAIFNDYFTFYLPKFGTSSESLCYDKVFNSSQIVRLKERESVLRLFPPPTASQSWRRVLSMGNLLNGHEPMIREIIFSIEDKVESGHYGTNGSWAPSDAEIETHRMYIRGTSNDLQVALSVVSWD